MKFSEMPYRRYEIEKAQEQFSAITEKIKAAKSAEEAAKLIRESDEIMKESITYSTIANVKSTIDTKDEFFSSEKDYYDRIGPLMQQAYDEVCTAILESPYLEELKTIFPKVFFTNLEIQKKSFSPEIVPLLQEENAVVSEYVKLLASAQFEFDGKSVTMPQLSAFMQSTDAEVRRKAVDTAAAFYKSHADELDTLYDKLVKIRTAAARKMGYENFVELGYNRMMRNSYTASDVEKFRKQVVEDLVPAAVRIKERQAKRIGAEKLSVYNDSLMFMSGNAKPTGTPEQILAEGKKMYEDLSPETAEFIRFMTDNELFDVLSKPGKAPGGYCTFIPEHSSPFIFANFNGTSGDVEVLTHEAGHALNAYVMGKKDVLSALTQATLETCEIHSMSMEYFTYPWMNKFFGDKTDKYMYKHLADSIVFIPYGTMVDHFQHLVYENPDMTPAERNKCWAELEKVYKPYIHNDGIPFYGEGRVWQRQAHIYEVPFYYIDYCLASSCALQFWAAMQENRQDAWERYFRLVSLGGLDIFTNLIKQAGLKSPFEDGMFKDIVSKIDESLDKLKIGE